MNRSVDNTLDSQLLLWLKKTRSTGDPESWGKVYDQFKQTVFFHCLRMTQSEADAQDLTSEVFIRAYERIDQLDLKRPFQPWLTSIATHICIDFIRARQRKAISAADPDEFATPEIEMNSVEHHELQEKITTAIRKLKRPQRRCFCLFYIQQKSYKEIAAFTGYSYDEVRSYIQNGKRNFKLIFLESE
ncbi:sigma-70 family RNA polymerase sigma factor [candidate division KSB1 bacterium]|nr:sigma-70 family RNA polymerase sigma factor [candidate division KSB1 bacterium]